MLATKKIHPVRSSIDPSAKHRHEKRMLEKLEPTTPGPKSDRNPVTLSGYKSNELDVGKRGLKMTEHKKTAEYDQEK